MKNKGQFFLSLNVKVSNYHHFRLDEKMVPLYCTKLVIFARVNNNHWQGTEDMTTLTRRSLITLILVSYIYAMSCFDQIYPTTSIVIHFIRRPEYFTS